MWINTVVIVKVYYFSWYAVVSVSYASLLKCWKVKKIPVPHFSLKDGVPTYYNDHEAEEAVDIENDSRIA